MYQTSLTKGQELVAQRMARELRRQGHEAYLITGIYHDQTVVVSNEELVKAGGYVRTFDESIGIPLVRVQSRKVSWPPRRVAFVDFVSTLSKIVDELGLDVLISHSTLWNGPEDAGKLVEWRRNQRRGGSRVHAPVLCHMSHFQEPTEERYDLRERSYREAWNSACLPMIMKLADFVLVTTPRERDQMKKMGADDKKLVLFPGGIESSVLEAGHTGFRRKYGIPERPKLVTYLGTIEERKNAATIVRIARALEDRQDVHFVIVGKLEGAYGQLVRASAAGLRNVTLTGPIPDEDIPGLIHESYLNLNMSRSEALGLSQLEFMYNGVPVVTSGVGGQSWIVRDGSSGVVLEGPEDIAGAVGAIAKLLDKPKRREKLGRKSRSIASQFTMPRLILSLTKTISAKITTDGGPRGEFERRNQVIEAWVQTGNGPLR